MSQATTFEYLIIKNLQNPSLVLVISQLEYQQIIKFNNDLFVLVIYRVEKATVYCFLCLKSEDLLICCCFM